MDCRESEWVQGLWFGPWEALHCGVHFTALVGDDGSDELGGGEVIRVILACWRPPSLPTPMAILPPVPRLALRIPSARWVERRVGRP